jgi:hypothetical protein
MKNILKIGNKNTTGGEKLGQQKTAQCSGEKKLINHTHV